MVSEHQTIKDTFSLSGTTIGNSLGITLIYNGLCEYYVNTQMGIKKLVKLVVKKSKI